jgi:hypothetical protein
MARAEPCTLDLRAASLHWRPAAMGEARQWPCSGESNDAGDLAHALRDSLGVLPEAAPVHLHVSACRARLFMLPWAEAMRSEARWQAFAHSRFDELFGEPAEAWSLRVVPERPGRPRLVAALSRELTDGVAEALGPRLASLRIGALMRLDALGAAHPRFTGAMVDVGERHAFVALLVDGRLQRVRLRRMAPRDADELRSVLAVEWAAAGWDEPMPALALGPGEVHDAMAAQGLGPVARTLIRLD